MDRTELFICKCNDVTHQLILSSDEERKVVYCSFHLDNYGLWERFKSALFYIIGKERKEGDFDSMLFNMEDIGRLRPFLQVLESGASQQCVDNVPQNEYVEINSGNKWKTTELYSWQFNSLDIVYTWDIKYIECLTISDYGKDVEICITPRFVARHFFARLRTGIRYIFGYRSRYGDFDSFEWTVEDAQKLYSLIEYAKGTSNI